MNDVHSPDPGSRRRRPPIRRSGAGRRGVSPGLIWLLLIVVVAGGRLVVPGRPAGRSGDGELADLGTVEPDADGPGRRPGRGAGLSRVGRRAATSPSSARSPAATARARICWG